MVQKCAIPVVKELMQKGLTPKWKQKKRILIAFQALNKAVAYGGVLSVNGPLLSILPKNIKYDRYNSNKYNSSKFKFEIVFTFVDIGAQDVIIFRE